LSYKTSAIPLYIRYNFSIFHHYKVEQIMRHITAPLFFLLTFSLFTSPSFAEESLWTTVKSDYSEFYSTDRFIRMGIIFAGGAVMANTSLDQNFQNDYQNKTRSTQTDDYAKTAKLFGEGKYLIPLSIISAYAGEYISGTTESALGTWGQRTARAYFVGGPTVLATQILTGASRPAEAPYKSDWKPFNDSNGVSGHAFIGSVPFLTIAYMNKDNAFIKYSAYLVSTFSAISRINDDAHYLSQAMLGWYLGWESVDAVYTVDSKKKNSLRIQPVVGADSYGVQLSMLW